MFIEKKQVPFDDYLASTGESISNLKKLDTSPAHYWHAVNTELETPSTSLGRLVHTLVLEPHTFDELYVAAPTVDRRTKAGKEAWAEIDADGRSIIKPDDLAKAKAMAANVLENDLAMEWLRDGERETSIWWEHEPTGITCRARLDCLRDDAVVDLKTSFMADPDGFAEAAKRYGYDQQGAWYAEAAQESGREPRDIVFVVVENREPYAVGVYRLSKHDWAHGRALNEQLLRKRLQLAQEGDHAEGFTWGQTQPITINLPKP